MSRRVVAPQRAGEPAEDLAADELAQERCRVLVRRRRANHRDHHLAAGRRLPHAQEVAHDPLFEAVQAALDDIGDALRGPHDDGERGHQQLVLGA